MMRYQFKGIAGKWNVYDEAGRRIGSVRSRGRNLEYRYGNNIQAYDIGRKKDDVWLEQDGKTFLSGGFCYPVDENGKRVQEFFLRPPMPVELKLEGEDEAWTLHQLPDRSIEIYHDGNRAGLLTGLVAGTKTLEWDGGAGPLEKGLLCFGLGVYMAEDDTVYIV